MKKNISDCNNFDKHKEVVVEFEPCEIVKQLDIEISMGDCTCQLPISPCPLWYKDHHYRKHWHKHQYKYCIEKCDVNSCNYKSLLMMLEHYNKRHRKHKDKDKHKHKDKVKDKVKDKDKHKHKHKDKDKHKHKHKNNHHRNSKEKHD